MLKQSMKWSWILILAVAAFTVACDKEQTDSLTDNTAIDTRTVSNVEMVAMEVDGMEHGPRCFSLIFPVTVLYPNGDEATAGDAESLRGLFRTWREQNPNAMDRPTLAYPYWVTMNDDGTEVEITGRDVLVSLLADCRANDPGHGPGQGGPGHNGPGHDGPGFGFNSPCFSLDYSASVTIYLPGQGEQVVTSEEELRAAIQAWREANPGPADERPALVMPYTVIFDDGSTLVIDEEADLETLREACQTFCPGDGGPHGPNGPGDDPGNNGPGFDGPGPLCFRLVFPVTVILPNGTELEANGRLALLRIRRAWRERNPGSDVHPTLGFPFTVTLEDGTSQEIDDPAEFDALVNSCGE
ncbi:MAG: hypothetical protein KDD09_10940 [Phaeodactylibacter sp.]|nr:hypothetical protein [Phaeodactylibacter sp.]